MKATGIVRRIDDLGRIVIPKEIRRTLRIRETDPLEIFTDKEGEIILKKYSPMGELAEFAKTYAESMSQTIGKIVLVTDRDQVIAAAGVPKKEIMDKVIGEELDNLIENREKHMAAAGGRDYVKVLSGNDEEAYTAQAISPILCEGDALGAVIVTTKDAKAHFTEAEQLLASTAADYLGKQMES